MIETNFDQWQHMYTCAQSCLVKFVQEGGIKKKGVFSLAATWQKTNLAKKATDYKPVSANSLLAYWTALLPCLHLNGQNQGIIQ